MPGINVQDQDENMSDAMADYIIDSIIVTKVRNGGNVSYMATDLKVRFLSKYSKVFVITSNRLTFFSLKLKTLNFGD